MGAGAEVLSAVQGAFRIAGRAFALAEQVARLFRSGCGDHCGAQVLFRETCRQSEIRGPLLLPDFAGRVRRYQSCDFALESRGHGTCLGDRSCEIQVFCCVERRLDFENRRGLPVARDRQAGHHARHDNSQTLYISSSYRDGEGGFGPARSSLKVTIRASSGRNLAEDPG